MFLVKSGTPATLLRFDQSESEGESPTKKEATPKKVPAPVVVNKLGSAKGTGMSDVG